MLSVLVPVYLAIAVQETQRHPSREWFLSSWWLLVPAGMALITLLLMVFRLVPHRRSSPPPPQQPPQQPGGSFVIGGPGVKVGRASITDSYSNHPEGFGGIYGDEIEDAKMERNTHDVPGRETEKESEEDS